MSVTLESLARDKEILLSRSALCRLRLRRDTHDLRDSLTWGRGAAAAVRSPTLRGIAFGLALSLAGHGRTARVVMLAGRIVLLAKLARSAAGYARKLAASPAYGTERTDPAPAVGLRAPLPGG